MKSIKTKQKLALLLCAGLLAGSISVPYSHAAAFQDVPADFWGQAEIQWAINQNIVNGYPDGTFKPNSAITRSEFLAMLIRAYQPTGLQEGSENESWADKYLAYAAQQGWKKAQPDNIRFTRGEVAQYLANATGKTFNADDSVLYLLDLGLSDGKNGKHLTGYDKEGTLTRAEAVTFIERFRLRYNALQSSSITESKYSRADTFEVYENDSFTILLPKSWHGKYELAVRSNEDKTKIYDFISPANKAYGGSLFTITVWPSEEWTAAGEEIADIIHMTKIGEKGKLTFTIGTATDIQYNLEDVKLKEEFTSMVQDILTKNYSVYLH